MSLHLSGDAEADELITSDAFALLVGMVLDQQIPLERAFAAPAIVRQRLNGVLDAGSLASLTPERVAKVFSDKPAVHRFPVAMAGRVQQLARLIVDEWAGDAASIWTTARSGEELVARVGSLPGFGPQKAKIFVALLGKQLGFRPPGWIEASSPFGAAGSLLSIADIDGPDSLAAVRAHKAEMKAAAKASAAR